MGSALTDRGLSAGPAAADDPTDSAIEAAAHLVATNPGAADHLAARHQRRPDGRCQGCATRLTWWPCAMVAIATRATEIRASQRTTR